MAAENKLCCFALPFWNYFTHSNYLWFTPQVCLGPKRRQTMVFSATMTTELDELVEISLTNAVRLSADPSAIRPATLTEEYSFSSSCLLL